MKLCVLGSGSKGQAVYVQAGHTRILFDAGFSARQLKRRLQDRGIAISDLHAVVLSHEHTDHVAGLRVLGPRLPVYATAGTFRVLKDRYDFWATETIVAGQTCELGDLSFTPMSVSHDAQEPVAFVLEDGMTRVAIVTDLGVVTRSVRHGLDDLDLAVVEANHDLDMLLNGPYPWDLKQRIKGNHGHLSNAQAAQLIAAIVHPGLKKVMLAHLSQQNNLPGLARDEVQMAIDGSGCHLTVCSQDAPTAMMDLK